MQILKKIFYKSALLLISIQFLSAQITTREYQVKAVFLYNFTQFVEWQQSSFAAPDAPMVIGILGKDPFGKYIDEAVANEVVNGHPLLVKRYNSIDEIKDCHILFINTNETNGLKETLENIKNQNILTVSDNSNFLKYGGIIRFFTQNDKIQLQINPEVAKSNNLTISSKLLWLAKIYKPD